MSLFINYQSRKICMVSFLPLSTIFLLHFVKFSISFFATLPSKKKKMKGIPTFVYRACLRRWGPNCCSNFELTSVLADPNGTHTIFMPRSANCIAEACNSWSLTILDWKINWKQKLYMIGLQIHCSRNYMCSQMIDLNTCTYFISSTQCVCVCVRVKREGCVKTAEKLNNKLPCMQFCYLCSQQNRCQLQE